MLHLMSQAIDIPQTLHRLALRETVSAKQVEINRLFTLCHQKLSLHIELVVELQPFLRSDGANSSNTAELARGRKGIPAAILVLLPAVRVDAAPLLLEVPFAVFLALE